MRTRMNLRRGATLPQMLAALVVTSGLVALALPMLGAMRWNSASAAAMWQATGVGRAIEAAAIDAGWYAPTFRSDADGGVTHFSAVLADGGYVQGVDAFTSPLAPGGGAPAAGDHVRQAPRLAFTVNGAIMPPEPLAYSGTDRHYRLVGHRGAVPQRGAWLTRQDEPVAPATTVQVTEWLADAGYSALRQGSRTLSHRPIVPFLGVSAGRSPEREAVAGAGPAPFVYPQAGDVFGDGANFAEVLASRGATEINAMGRSHRQGNSEGRAALIMLDGSARLATPLQSVTQRLWGEAFHSITGGQGVR